MDILPSEEEQMLKNAAREVLEAEVSTAMVREMELDEIGYPPALWRQMADLGWLGLAIPEAYGGQGLPLTYLGMIMEELGRVLAPVPLHSTMVAALTIAEAGTEAQKREILPGVCTGSTVLTWAVTERDPRLVPEAIVQQAEPDGDGWVLNGEKMFVENFIVAQKCLTAVRTAPASDENEGISLFLIDPNGAGVSQTPLVTIAKDKQSRVGLDGVRVTRDDLVGELHEGWPILEAMLDRATALLCCQMIGATRKDAEMATDYAKNRVAFGRPIGSFQSIQHLCADMLLHVDGGQLLTYEALWKMDQGLPASVEVSQAKAFCNEKCESVVRSSQVIHGGIGFMMEFDLHLWFRRVSAWSMRLGTTFEHRARIASALLDKAGPGPAWAAPSRLIQSGFNWRIDMAKDPVCGKEIDEEQARAQTSLTRHGASEVDPQQGTRIFHDGSWIYFCGLGVPHPVPRQPGHLPEQLSRRDSREIDIPAIARSE